MTRDGFNALCAGLTASTHVVQWGDADVWKVGGKMYAVGWWELAEPAFTFKVTPTVFEILRDMPGLRPAPYLASRGMSWIQHYAAPGLDDAALADQIRDSHALVASGLSKKKRLELGIPIA